MGLIVYIPKFKNTLTSLDVFSSLIDVLLSLRTVGGTRRDRLKTRK